MDELDLLFTSKLNINTLENTLENTLKKTIIADTIKKELIQQLKTHLSVSIIIHDKEILKESTIKNAHLYCVIKHVSSQQYGPLIETYIRVKHNFIKNSATQCNGDCKKDNKNVEIKASLGGITHNKFNWVQIRVSHDIDYYIFTAYYLTDKNVEDCGELYIFNVPKIDMFPLIVKYGGYAHGTKEKNGPITLEDLQNVKNMKEYSLRPTFGNKCWMDILKFRVDEKSL